MCLSENWFAVNGNWGEWAAASGCTVACGGGTLPMVRVCDNPAFSNGGADCDGDSSKSLTCNEDPCAGKTISQSRC